MASDIASALLGDGERVAVERAIAEFRSGRPIVLIGESGPWVALPIDGASDARIAALRELCAPETPELAITAQRAAVLGIEADAPVLLDVGTANAAQLLDLAAASASAARQWRPAGAAAEAAIRIAKRAQRLPALLFGKAAQAELARTLVSVDAKAALALFRDPSPDLTIVSEAALPLADGIESRAVIFRGRTGECATALIIGSPDRHKPVPVRLHSSCLTGDVFGSRRCDCGDQLRMALAMIHEAGGGILLYLEQEGRGLGLANKIRAYALQDAGLDTIDANVTLGFQDDERHYRTAACMLAMLDFRRILLLTNNPDKLHGLAKAGAEVVGRAPLTAPVNIHNQRYLTAKASRAGHFLEALIRGAADKTSESSQSSPAS